MPKVNQREDKKPAPMPLSQAIRQAGTGGITKQELKQITQDSGKSSGNVVQKLDKINQNIKKNDGVGINLNSGAANMLIREASKAAPSYDNFLGLGTSTFGPGKIGQTLQSMVGSKASGGYINPQSGKQSFSSAVSPQMMIGGTQIRGGGRVAVQGFGKQYSYSGGTGGAGPYDGMEIPGFNPNGPGPLAPNKTTQPTQQEPVIEDPIIKDPATTPTDPGPGMLSGGGSGAAGANKLGRAKSRLRQLGIYGRGTGLLGRGLQYGNALNA